MTAPVRGRALIINNLQFENEEIKKIRHGSQLDVHYMSLLVTLLNFEKEIKRNLTAQVFKITCNSYTCPINLSSLILI